MAKKHSGKENKTAEPPVEAVEEPVETLDPLTAAEERIAALEDKVLRARADYDNLQKRHLREADAERARAKARVLDPMLQVFEFAQMAAVEAEKSPGALAEGVKMLVREFERHLEEQGIARFGTVGETFDANLHEATGEFEADGVAPGCISTVVRPGYKLGERVLRYAKVTTQPAN